MNYVLKTYVDFLYANPLLSKTSAKEVRTRDITKLKVPENAFAFRFFDIISLVVEVDGQKVELKSQQINVSPRHYYGGKIYTVAELKLEFPGDLILICNIERSGCKKAIKCRTGNWRPFEETDLFVKEAA